MSSSELGFLVLLVFALVVLVTILVKRILEIRAWEEGR